MKKFWRSLTVFILVTSSLSVLSTQTANAGIETDSYCALDFQTDVPVQPVNPAFTFEMKYALAYDANWSYVTTTNSYGGVLTSDHTTLVGTADTNSGLQVYYNTNWLSDNSALFFIGEGRTGKFHYFNNPEWKFPNFTKSEGSSRYIHIAVVRDASDRLSIFFDGKAPTKSWSSESGESGGYTNSWSSNTYVTDTNTYTTARYVGYDTTFNTSVNPKAYVSGIKFVTGHNLYDPTASTIAIPSNTTIKTASTTGSTPLLLNSQTAPTVVTNSGNAGLGNAVMKAFGAGGVGCPDSLEDTFIGGDGVYNVYYKEGNVLKDSGSAPKIRDFYYSEDASPAAITITDAGTMVKAGNTFIGWNTQSDGSGQTYRAGDSFSPTNNITLYTKWSTPKTVTYYNGGGTGTLPIESNKLWEDQFEVAANPLDNGVLDFIGWIDGNGNTYQPGATYTVANSNVTLTARWTEPTTISIADISITAPVTGATPVTSTTSNGQYTTTISWSESPNPFLTNTMYTATVTVIPDPGYTLSGVPANFFTVNGAATTTGNSADSGSFTQIFAATTTTISIAEIPIAAPVTGQLPSNFVAGNGEYIAYITWSGSPDTFASDTIYTATITVVPEGGYTLSGVPANFFTVNGAATTTGNLANAGSFTQIFAATATTISTAAISLTAPVTGATPETSTASNGQFSTTVTWSPADDRFRSNTVYTATITVTPDSGYTLSGVSANFFTIDGASSVTNDPDSGVVTAVLAATGGKIAQTITFDAPNPMTRLSSYQSLTGTSTAGIQYTPSYSVSTPSICSYVGGAVVQTAVGTCVITASQAGDDIYLAAAPVVRSFAVTRAPQTITIGTLNPMTRSSEDQTLVATSSEGLTPITFSTTSPACSIVAGKLRAVAAGTCSIVASQVGSDTIAAASAIRTGIVIAKDSQTINFIQPTGMRVGGSQQTLTATSSAGLTTTLSSLTPAVCSVVNRKIQPIKLGSCIIASDQLGNTNTAPAPRVLRTVTIRP